MRRRICAALVAVVVGFVPLGHSAAQEVPPEVEGAVSAAEAILAQLEAAAQAVAEAAEDDPVEVLAVLLEQEMEVDLGDGNDPVVVSLAELINTIAGESLIDSEGNGGILGTPQIHAGTILHILVDINLELFPFPGVPEAELPPAPQLQGYDVVEAQLSPTTPLLPIINPLVLVGPLLGVDLPDEVVEIAPGLTAPLLGLHGGGRLKNIKAEITGSLGGLGLHSAGTGVIGYGLDTEARETTEDDPWPVWVPAVTNGMLTDDGFDFVGFAQVIQGQACTLTTVLGNVVARTCTLTGTILGDGVTELENRPLDFRSDLAPLWEEQPQEIQSVVGVIDEVIEAIPVEDLLELLDLLDLELPETGV